MDPNAALAQLREFFKQVDDFGDVELHERVGDAITIFQGLDEWLSKGGMLPEDWAQLEQPPGSSLTSEEAEAMLNDPAVVQGVLAPALVQHGAGGGVVEKLTALGGLAAMMGVGVTATMGPEETGPSKRELARATASWGGEPPPQWSYEVFKQQEEKGLLADGLWGARCARAGIAEPEHPFYFPIIKGKDVNGDDDRFVPRRIPWAVLAPYEEQAERNHDQTLKRLAERGGLDVSETAAVILGLRWKELQGDLDDHLAVVLGAVERYHGGGQEQNPVPSRES